MKWTFTSLNFKYTLKPGRLTSIIGSGRDSHLRIFGLKAVHVKVMRSEYNLKVESFGNVYVNGQRIPRDCTIFDGDQLMLEKKKYRIIFKVRCSKYEAGKKTIEIVDLTKEEEDEKEN